MGLSTVSRSMWVVCGQVESPCKVCLISRHVLLIIHYTVTADLKKNRPLVRDDRINIHLPILPPESIIK